MLHDVFDVVYSIASDRYYVRWYYYVNEKSQCSYLLYNKDTGFFRWTSTHYSYTSSPLTFVQVVGGSEVPEKLVSGLINGNFECDVDLLYEDINIDFNFGSNGT